MRAGRSREDLYSQLCAFAIDIPAGLIADFNRSRWPGHARGLKSVLLHLHALTGGGRVDASFLHTLMRMRNGR